MSSTCNSSTGVTSVGNETCEFIAPKKMPLSSANVRRRRHQAVCLADSSCANRHTQAPGLQTPVAAELADRTNHPAPVGQCCSIFIGSEDNPRQQVAVMSDRTAREQSRGSATANSGDQRRFFTHVKIPNTKQLAANCCQSDVNCARDKRIADSFDADDSGEEDAESTPPSGHKSALKTVRRHRHPHLALRHAQAHKRRALNRLLANANAQPVELNHSNDGPIKQGQTTPVGDGSIATTGKGGESLTKSGRNPSPNTRARSHCGARNKCANQQQQAANNETAATSNAGDEVIRDKQQQSSLTATDTFAAITTNAGAIIIGSDEQSRVARRAAGLGQLQQAATNGAIRLKAEDGGKANKNRRPVTDDSKSDQRKNSISFQLESDEKHKESTTCLAAAKCTNNIVSVKANQEAKVSAAAIGVESLESNLNQEADTCNRLDSNENDERGSERVVKKASEDRNKENKAGLDYLVWEDIVEANYGKMSRPPNHQHHQQKLVTNFASGSNSTLLSTTQEQNQISCGKKPSLLGGASQLPYGNGSISSSSAMTGNYRRNAGKRIVLFNSCFCHLVCATLGVLFPILDSFKHYSLPGDLFTDLAAGFTIAVLHIPQGMAYGLLAGVEPIYGLYVSFVPVIIMSLMSKSRHVSYGTFAVISMLLMNSIDSVRMGLKKSLQANPMQRSTVPDGLVASDQQLNTPLVLTNNHQPPVLDTRNQIKSFDMEAATLQPPAALPTFDQFQADQYAAAGALAANATGLLATVAASAQDGLAAFVAHEPPAGPFQMPTNIEILTCVCFICGIIHITMSLMRLGVLSLMFSDQLVSSFTTASAIHVVTSQLPGLVDLKLPPIQRELFKVVLIWWQFLQKIIYWPSASDQQAEAQSTAGPNEVTAVMSLLSIVFLLFIKELIEPRLRQRFKSFTCLPSELLLMAIVILCSWNWRFAETFNVKIVGYVPTELPSPKVPRLELMPFVLQDAITIGLISFAMNLSLAQVYAKEFKYKLDANQELFALGTANIVGSFFSCFPCASSLSRSSVQSCLNVKSQLCSLFSSAIVLVIICYAAPILHHLPRSTLSCIIVVALKGILVQVRDFCANWRLSKLDALVWLFTFLSVIIFGVTYGLFVGIVASLFTVFFRLLTPNHSILGRLPGTDIYVDLCAFNECKEIEQTKIFRFNSALCYLNRTMLRSRVEKCLPSIYEPQGFHAICSRFHSASNPPINHSSRCSTTSSDLHPQAQSAPTQQAIEYLIIDCSAFAYCDCSGVATLVELIDDLYELKVRVYLAACPLKMIDILERMGRGDIIKQNCFPTITDAIGQIKYLRNFGLRPGYQSEQFGAED